MFRQVMITFLSLFSFCLTVLTLMLSFWLQTSWFTFKCQLQILTSPLASECVCQLLPTAACLLDALETCFSSVVFVASLDAKLPKFFVDTDDFSSGSDPAITLSLSL